MKFTMNREILLDALNHVSKGLSSKTPMPVLSGIKIEVSRENIILTTTNREISVQIVLDTSEQVTVYEEGDCLVPGKYFIEIIKKVEGKTVDFTLFEENTIKILSDRSNFTLIALEKTNFPDVSFESLGTPINIKSTLLRQIIKQTAFAAGTSEARVVLTGVCFELKDDKLEVVATDSYRLSKKVTQLPENHQPIQINIPSKALEELNKILENKDTDVELFIISNKALFKIQNIAFMTRLIEGNFPDTNSLSPNTHIVEIEFNKNDLLATIDRTQVFTGNDISSTIKMVLNRDKTVHVFSSSSEIGRVVDEIYPLKVQGIDQFQVAFSARYFLEALRAFESQVVSMKLTGELKPFTITGQNDDNLIQLILPVRTF